MSLGVKGLKDTPVQLTFLLIDFENNKNSTPWIGSPSLKT